MVADYLVEYAEQNATSIRCGVEVAKVKRIKGRTGFCVETSGGVYEATNVVEATGPFQNPIIPTVTRSGDRVYGRGTTDMKGFLASTLAAADRASKLDLTQPFKLSLSYDEEIGCVGIAHIIGDLERCIGLPDMAIIGEPTSIQVAIGHKGKGACGQNVWWYRPEHGARTGRSHSGIQTPDR